MSRFTFPVVAFVLSTLTASAAAAHITMTEPAPRRPDQKVGPCGLGADDPRGPNVTTFQGGQTITVRWTETIEHPGHFRISFDADGQDDFADPAAYDDYYTNAAVLVDQIEDKVGFGQTYEQEITLPMMSCDGCTLQLVQVMTDKPPYEVGTNDLYYQCADIVLEGAADTTGDATTGGSSSEGTSGDATSGTPTSGDATTGNDSAGSGTGGSSSGGAGTSGGMSDGTTGGGASGTDAADIDDGAGGCGCRGGGSGSAGMVALVLLALGRRRRGA